MRKRPRLAEKLMREGKGAHIPSELTSMRPRSHMFYHLLAVPRAEGQAPGMLSSCSRLLPSSTWTEASYREDPGKGRESVPLPKDRAE